MLGILQIFGLCASLVFFFKILRVGYEGFLGFPWSFVVEQHATQGQEFRVGNLRVLLGHRRLVV